MIIERNSSSYCKGPLLTSKHDTASRSRQRNPEYLEHHERVYMRSPTNEDFLDETVYNENVATKLSKYAIQKAKKDDWREALLSWKKALNIIESIHGEEHPLVAKYLNKIGIAYYFLGESFYAYDSFEKALELQEFALSPEQEQLTVTLDNIKFLLAESGECIAERRNV